MNNLIKVSRVLKDQRLTSDDLEKQFINGSFKCLAASLRQQSVIDDFLRHKDQLFMRVIHTMKQNLNYQSVIKRGLMVLKQIFCTNQDTYELIDQHLKLKYIKMLLRQIMLLHTKSDTHINELALICLL